MNAELPADLPVAWQFATITDMDRSGVPDAARWLADDERATWASLRATYRREWTAGRILAKQLILQHQGLSPSDARAINITSRDSHGRGIRPRVAIHGDVIPCSLSISHADGAVLAAFTTAGGVSVGVDVVRRQPFAPAFSRRWFTELEQESVTASEDHDLEICRVWAMKEAVYKAACQDEPFAPRLTEIRNVPNGHRCAYRGLDLADRCRIRIWLIDNHVCSVAVVNDTTARVQLRPAPARRTTRTRCLTNEFVPESGTAAYTTTDYLRGDKP
ncbi:MAG: 4'-phosphopantetheinyl transferase superfamily protein [Pirellulaceae bacterium]|nr:4'-phosphopantetheinyl transferase superfamily protein [Pirellulaceae bacterium]